MNPVLPLLALRAFTEVARYNSIKQAAQVLGVTSGAVSQQIRLLETRVGRPLFIRQRYHMVLTEEAARIYPTLLQAFEQIESSMRQLEETKVKNSLTISTVPSFAASWLIPRLGDFRTRYPEIELRIEASANLVNLRKDPVDIAIRHGLGKYPGLHTEHLMTPTLLPVASPHFFTHGKITKMPVTPEACLNYPLLQDSDRADWSLWLTAHGVKIDERAKKGSTFDDDYLLIRAAIAGQGIALVPQAYAQQEMTEGRLIQVLDKPWPAQFAYYLVMLEASRQRPEVDAFVCWIQQQAAMNIE
ncbi:transcriptional regulator GcvA [Providencia vermicola]|uniref:Transcriptional regulator GcvA n=1 Tax=Providencia vermicola TaxID=333965 RepID=A0AAX3S011_9GAMM|nr:MULTISPECIES: transcriptional regulator GcvA [Providencia]ELR5119452.1 transcriptional regulator GcvA [Providencia stuartii]ELX8379551.1 transcriptional regulator GcvA [Providencia stuartii]EMD5258755.1 transcriptional regulator GcvA [Providencia stuartii]QIC15555.1 transcriptional regulator GcvA [Providencia vermicola]USB35680.1 transcriptional regulator GcvA [Providencia vermicola]